MVVVPMADDKKSDEIKKSDTADKGKEPSVSSELSKSSSVGGHKDGKEESKDAVKVVPGNKCSICMEALQPQLTMVTACNHKFHRKCILTWLNDKNSTCPMDRTNLAVPAIGDEIDSNEDTLAQQLNQTCSTIDLPDPKNGPYSREIVFSTVTRPLAIEAGPSSRPAPRSAPTTSRTPTSPGPGQRSQSAPGRGQGGRGRQAPRPPAPDPVGQALMGIAPGRGGRRSSPSPGRGSRVPTPNRTQGIDPAGLQMSTGRGTRASAGASSLERQLSNMPMPNMEPEPHKMVLWFNNLRPQVELKNMSDQYNVIILQSNKILGVVPKRSKAMLLIFLIVGPPGKSMIRGNLYPQVDTLTFWSNGIEKRLTDDEEYKKFISDQSNKRSLAFVQRRNALNEHILGQSGNASGGKSGVTVKDGKSNGSGKE